MFCRLYIKIQAFLIGLRTRLCQSMDLFSNGLIKLMHKADTVGHVSVNFLLPSLL